MTVTPNRVQMTEPAPLFTVVSGQLVTETAISVELTRRMVLAWLEGLRDLRNGLLLPFYEETARSRVGADAEERYAVIQELASELGITPVSFVEFSRLFLPSSAAETFRLMLGRLGLEETFVQDVVTETADVLEYKNPVQPELTKLQETGDLVVNPDNVATLLDELAYPSLVSETDHFIEDYVENDALDGDAKAHERIFSTFGDYIHRLLLVGT